MTSTFFFWQARDSMLKLFGHCRDSFLEPGEQPRPSDCGEDAQRRIRRLAIEELDRAGWIGQKLDRLQQAEIGLKVSRRLLEEGIKGI